MTADCLHIPPLQAMRPSPKFAAFCIARVSSFSKSPGLPCFPFLMDCILLLLTQVYCTHGHLSSSGLPYLLLPRRLFSMDDLVSIPNYLAEGIGVWPFVLAKGDPVCGRRSSGRVAGGRKKLRCHAPPSHRSNPAWNPKLCVSQPWKPRSPGLPETPT